MTRKRINGITKNVANKPRSKPKESQSPMLFRANEIEPGQVVFNKKVIKWNVQTRIYVGKGYGEDIWEISIYFEDRSVQTHLLLQ